MEGEGFEPSKPVATDLQSVPFDRSGTPPLWPCQTRRSADARASNLLSLCLVSLEWRSWRWESNPQPADYKSAALPLSYASAGFSSDILRFRLVRWSRPRGTTISPAVRGANVYCGIAGVSSRIRAVLDSAALRRPMPRIDNSRPAKRPGEERGTRGRNRRPARARAKRAGWVGWAVRPEVPKGSRILPPLSRFGSGGRCRLRTGNPNRSRISKKRFYSTCRPTASASPGGVRSGASPRCGGAGGVGGGASGGFPGASAGAGVTPGTPGIFGSSSLTNLV